MIKKRSKGKTRVSNAKEWKQRETKQEKGERERERKGQVRGEGKNTLRKKQIT